MHPEHRNFSHLTEFNRIISGRIFAAAGLSAGKAV
jgi:hypothetical protein